MERLPLLPRAHGNDRVGGAGRRVHDACPSSSHPVERFGPQALTEALSHRASVTAFLSNDATALPRTPVVATLLIQLRLSPVPYLFATTFIADSASSLLPASNPIAVLLLGERIDLPTFFRFLLVPALFAIVAK